ncbi:MAG: efflux RND transporter periplasmic adaptor subunit [Betaproteobacteria bacterium]
MDPSSRSEREPVKSIATPSRRARWLGSAIALLALAAVLALAWYLTHRPAAYGPGAPGGAGGASRGAAPRSGPSARSVPPSTVGVARARHADIPVYIEALGTVTPIAVATVSPQVSGVITDVLYKEGEVVRKGQVLAQIDPRPFQAALDQTVAARERDAAQLEAARVQLARYQVLLTQDSIARQTVDTQDALVKQLEGTVAVDRANEASARLNLQWSRVVAPIGGRVGLRPIDAGNYITAGSTSGVATITQVAPIDVQFAIPQERVPDIKDRIAARAKLPVAAFDSTRTRKLDDGEFMTLDNQIDVQTGTVKAKARFANAAGDLFPNQFVNVRLVLRTVDAAVVVPVTALRHGPSGDFVYVVNDDHTVSQRDVTAGIAGVDDVEIAKGLAVGEEVVTEGGDRLKDGARIQTSAGGAAAPPREGKGAPAQGMGAPGTAAPRAGERTAPQGIGAPGTAVPRGTDAGPRVPGERGTGRGASRVQDAPAPPAK